MSATSESHGRPDYDPDNTGYDGADPSPMPLRRRSYVDPPSLGLAPGCIPVRTIAKKSRRISRPGVFGTRKSLDGRAIRTESILEMEGLAHIETNAHYVRIAPQPHRLIFHADKPDGSTRVHTYVPDFVVLTRDATVIVVDCKWTSLRALPEWAALEPVIREAYWLDHGALYRVLTEEHLLLEPRRTNVAIMLMHRPVVPNEPAITAVRRAVARCGLPSTIGALRDASGLRTEGPYDPAFSALIELAMSGEVRLDLSRLFDDDTRVAAGGRA